MATPDPSVPSPNKGRVSALQEAARDPVSPAGASTASDNSSVAGSSVVESLGGDSFYAVSGHHRSLTWAQELAACRDPEYHWTKYPRLRHVSEFKRGVARDHWQPKRLLKKSMTGGWKKRGRSGRLAAALKLHEKLMSMCGDRPSRRAQDVNCGIIHGIVAEGGAPMAVELWLQLLRHVTANTNRASLLRAWAMAAFAVNVCLIPDVFRPFLLHALQTAADDSRGMTTRALLLVPRRQLWCLTHVPARPQMMKRLDASCVTASGRWSCCRRRSWQRNPWEEPGTRYCTACLLLRCAANSVQRLWLWLSHACMVRWRCRHHGRRWSTSRLLMAHASCLTGRSSLTRLPATC